MPLTGRFPSAAARRRRRLSKPPNLPQGWGVRRHTGEDAGSGFEFRSRFDDMPGGARGIGVNGQGIVGGKVNIALDTEPEGSPVFGQFEQTD